MATQQAWDDFCELKAKEAYIQGELTNCLKDAITKLEVLVAAIVADPVRAAEAVALADQHPIWNSAHILDLFAKMQAVKAAIIAQGF